ncbi:hydrophobic surface binding protein A-domain-containing protein [Xylaria palmicola]|nr:hydrophobic surface binding protein A-domain-containing protein [Xylaria palmicola]
MKATTFLPIALAFTATAEMQLYSLPTPAKRDLATVTSVAAQISEAITKLDDSVKAFVSDTTQLKQDAESLVSTIKAGAASVVSSGPISLDDALGLQTVAASVATAGGALLMDLEAKKDALEAAGLCGTVHSAIQGFTAEVADFIDGVVKQLPQESQDVVRQLTGSITDTLTGGASSFAASQCKSPASSSVDTPSATSIEADTYPTSAAASSSAATGAVTVTVTAPCVCSSSSSSVSIPVLTPTVSVPFPTGSNSTSIVPTGALTTTSATTIPTAGAGVNGVGAVGLMAGLAAALFV